MCWLLYPNTVIFCISGVFENAYCMQGNTRKYVSFPLSYLVQVTKKMPKPTLPTVSQESLGKVTSPSMNLKHQLDH